MDVCKLNSDLDGSRGDKKSARIPFTMKNKRKPNTFGKLFLKIIEDEKSFVSHFVSGHLVIEFLLRKLIQIYDPKLENLTDYLSFYQIVKLNFELKIITEEQEKTLIEVNKIRNKCVHEITYEPSVLELKKVLTLASKGFTDFTDGIEQSLNHLKNVRSVSVKNYWVIVELFLQISYDLFHEYQDRGGKKIKEELI